MNKQENDNWYQLDLCKYKKNNKGVNSLTPSHIFSNELPFSFGVAK